MAFYKITAPNGKISYVYGTCHSADATVNKLSKEVAEAFEKSSTLLVEADMDQGLIGLGMEMYQAATRWAERYGAEHVGWRENPQNVSDAVTSVAKHFSWHVSRFSIASSIKKTPPILLATQLTYLSHQDSSYLDKNLAIKAKKNHKTIVGLQPVSELLDLYTGLALSYEEQRRVFELLMANYSHANARIKKQELTTAYLADGIGAGYQFLDNPQGDALIARVNRAILQDRDVIMSDKLEKHFQSGNAFVAVGAAHLPGIKSIFEQKHGYSVEEIAISERIYPVLDYTTRHFSQILATGALVMAGVAILALAFIVSPPLLGLGLFIAAAALLALGYILTHKLILDYMREPALDKAASPLTASRNGFFSPSVVFAPSVVTDAVQPTENAAGAAIGSETDPLKASTTTGLAA